MTTHARCMRAIKRLLFITVIPAIAHNSFALTKTWTGLAGNGLWASAANWSNNSLPAASDDVVLDNSVIATDYTVTLPNNAVSIRTLSLSPAAAHSIRLVLPATNMVAPALTVTGPGYGIVINSGGIFRNQSGLSTGASLSIADSLRINNNGRYIHSSRSPSATSIVQLLSKAPGTERGIFEYDVPGTANYDVSVTRRVYGTLVLSAAAAGSNRTYTGSGANLLTVNGNLEINAGVTFRLDLTGAGGNVSIYGDYIQNGGVFNIANGPNSTIVKIAGNLQQSATGNITETDAGLPVIELNGATTQSVALRGTITNSVVFRMNNPAGAYLQSPLSLPYRLDLSAGVLTTSPANLLTLAAACSISADSSSSNSYIDGPLRKEGLSNTPWFLFPVGAAPAMQWAGLKDASGSFTVTYIKTDPNTLNAAYDTSIAAISNLGYWTITPDAIPSASAYIGFSYHGPNTAGITDMAALRVAQLSGGLWASRGNTGYTGNAGTAGTVTSEWLGAFPGAVAYFTLASAAAQHPLAIEPAGPVAPMVSNNLSPRWDFRVMPYANHIKIIIKARQKIRLDITLFTMQGALVKKRRVNATEGNTMVDIDWIGWAAGIYVLMLHDERGTVITRPFMQQ